MSEQATRKVKNPSKWSKELSPGEPRRNPENNPFIPRDL